MQKKLASKNKYGNGKIHHRLVATGHIVVEVGGESCVGLKGRYETR